jgi:CRP-like cAMP-binding protein
MYRVVGLLPPSDQFFQALAARAVLDDVDAAALASLDYALQTIKRGTSLAEEGQVRQHVSLVRSGYAMRYRQTRNGGRQIISVDTAGDIIDTSYLFFDQCDQTVEALTNLEVADIPVADLRRVLDARPNLMKALVVDTLVHASITQQWLANTGGRSARSRTAHLLCEFAVRVGRRRGGGAVIEYELPLTQTELAETLGLTLVHMNRTLKQLAADGLIERKRERVRILDIIGLEAAADFSARYLHLDRSSRDRRAVKRPA